MFCPSCGAEQSQTLSYCNRCGANLKPTQLSMPPAKLVGAAWAISLAVALITLGGFGMIFGLVFTLIDRGSSLDKDGVALVIFGSLIILAIDWLLIRQLARVLDLPRAGANISSHEPPVLTDKTPAQLQSPLQPVSSVTDPTTRTLEPAARNRDTQR